MNVYFLFFEKANFPFAASLMRDLRSKSRFRPVYMPGFDYKEFAGTISPLRLPEDITCRYAEDYLDPAAVAAANRRARSTEALFGRLQRKLTELPPGSTQPRASRALSCSLEKLQHLAGFPSVLQCYFRYQAALREFCRTERPAVAVLPEDTDYIRGRLAATILRDSGVAVLIAAPPWYSRFRSYPLVGPRYADGYLVGSTDHRRRLLQCGVPPEKISLIAYPEDFAGMGRDRAPGGYLLYAMQGIAWERLIVRDLCSIVRGWRDAPPLLLRPHPEASAAWLHAELDPGKDIALCPSHSSAESALAGACAVLGQTSGLIEQALRRGIPAAAVQYDGLPPLIDYSDAPRHFAVLRDKHQIAEWLAARPATAVELPASPGPAASTELLRRLGEIAYKPMDRAIRRKAIHGPGQKEWMVE